KPDFQEVMLYLNRDPLQALEDLNHGVCQLAQSNNKNLDAFVRVSGRYKMLVHDSVFVRYLSFDVRSEKVPNVSVPTNPFRDKRVRQALLLGIDRNRLVRNLSSYAVPATQPVPPFVFGFDPTLTAPSYDLESARSLLASAGYSHGFSVRLNVRK